MAVSDLSTTSWNGDERAGGEQHFSCLGEGDSWDKKERYDMWASKVSESSSFGFFFS